MKNDPQDPSPACREPWQTFGALLRQRRNAARLSRSTLARKAKLSDATIKFIETARTRPSRATLLCLLSVPELRLTWADVPERHKPSTGNQSLPLAGSPERP